MNLKSKYITHWWVQTHCSSFLVTAIWTCLRKACTISAPAFPISNSRAFPREHIEEVARHGSAILKTKKFIDKPNQELLASTNKLLTGICLNITMTMDKNSFSHYLGENKCLSSTHTTRYHWIPCVHLILSLYLNLVYIYICIYIPIVSFRFTMPTSGAIIETLI